jgi:hypothetical protein
MMTLEPEPLGIAMDGLEDTIARHVCRIMLCFQEVTYVEIGVAAGGTLTAIASMMNSWKGQGFGWRAIGIELPDGYSYDAEGLVNNAASHKVDVEMFRDLEPTHKVDPEWEKVTVYFTGSHPLLENSWDQPIHLALIDGCHGKRCATLDFLLLEPWIAPGGIVMFHDIEEGQVGSFQPHCGTLDVIGAVRDLGLLENKREGWEFIEIAESKPTNADMGIFRRTI